MHYKDIINIIKARRESLQVTQEMLAMLSGVGLRTLKQFESGKGNPTLLTLQKVGDALGLEVTITVKSTGTTSTTTTTATTATPSWDKQQYFLKARKPGP